MIPNEEILLRLLLGALIGGVIGFEREIHGRAAGFRTQLIVCVAAVLIMVVSENYHYHIHSMDDSLRIDPARISAGALIGIGFLGGGVIIKSGYAVRGLTTAASIWIVSAIGLAIGGGLYFEGAVTAIITIIALMFLRALEIKIKTLRFKNISISTSSDSDREEDIISILKDNGFSIHAIDYKSDHPAKETTYNFTVSTKDVNAKKVIFRKLSSLDSVISVKIVG